MLVLTRKLGEQIQISDGERTSPWSPSKAAESGWVSRPLQRLRSPVKSAGTE
jgi:hypothetical protein